MDYVTRFTSGWSRRILTLAVLLAACDPARKGDYQGDFPAPQTLSFAAIAAASASAAVWIYTSTHQPPQQARDWQTWNTSPTNGWFKFEGPTQMQSVLWPSMANALNSPSNQILPFAGSLQTNATVAYGTVALSFVKQTTSFFSEQLVAAGLNHVLVASDRDVTVQPVGPSGPSVEIKAGFQLLSRTCTADDPNVFQAEPLDTTIEMVPVAPAFAGLSNQLYDASRSAEAAYVSACGLTLATPDLGQSAMFPAAATVSSAGMAWSLAWGPDALYFVTTGAWTSLATTITGPGIVGRLNPADLTFTTIASGNYAGPIQLATQGTTLIVGGPNSQASRIAVQPNIGLLAGSLLPGLSLTLPVLLSPDGKTLAVSSNIGLGVVLADMATGAETALTRAGTPLAWAPDGKALLLASSIAFPPSQGQLVPTDGSAMSATVEGLPSTFTWQVDSSCSPDNAITKVSRYYWTPSGIYLLLQDCQGMRAQNLITGQSAVVVEANRVAAPDAPLDVVLANDQIFAWAIQCFGLGETSCNAELRRLSLATGQLDVVATANRALSFAVSPDGKKLATADGASIYIKTIAP